MEGFLLWMILGAIEVGIFVMLAIAVIVKNPGKPMGRQIGAGLVLMVFCAFGGIGYMLYLLLKAEPAQQPPAPAPQGNTP